jgi:nitroreductase
MMGVANLGLTAVDMGLGTAIRTGAVMNDPAARSAIGVVEGQRVVAIVNVGEPAEVPPPKNRTAASACTTWVP